MLQNMLQRGFIFCSKSKTFVECDVMTINAINIHIALSKLTFDFTITTI